MPPAHILERARIEPLCDDLEEHFLRCRIVLEGIMVPLEDGLQWQANFSNAKVSINNGFQLPRHTVTEISIPMRLRPS
jgi:hypothetical protein